jgi:hypothetical protein
MKKQTLPVVIVQESMDVAKKPERNLFIKVTTLNADNQEIGSRIVDMYHFGTKNWLQAHQWWAMHNAHVVETCLAHEDEVSAYIANRSQELVERFAADMAHEATA